MVHILITAGPTREYLDDVRFLSNGSSGRMGFALAEAARAAGHEPYLVLGPVELAPPQGVRVRSVTSAVEMQQAAEAWFAECQIAIAAAAVADWRPARRAAGKPARGGPDAVGTTLELVPNPDIVAGLGAHKGDRVVVGFALESAAAPMEQAVERGRHKLQQKHLDLCVCNRTSAIGSDDSSAVLLFADGRRLEVARAGKSELAAAIVRAAVDLYRERQRVA
ncbi:MAG: phosphopantothenoylcysteine decarboxylase [Planctomycetota bacterium]